MKSRGRTKNKRFAQRIWGKLPRIALTTLAELTDRYSLSVPCGDLLLLNGLGLVAAATHARSSQQAEELWAYRQSIDASLNAAGLTHGHNIALPISRFRAFYTELEALHASSYSDWELCLFAHVGDGTLQVRIIKPETLDKRTFLARCHAFDTAMFDLVRAYQGGVSAEHGIGLLKKASLAQTRSAAEIDLMRALKRVMDPLGILNPGKVL